MLTKPTQSSHAGRRIAAWLAPALAICLLSPSARAQWTQWGGPNADFMVESDPLNTSWPEDGPPRIWSRELGEGYSSILVDGGNLYTMYRKDSKERVIALDAVTGKTKWEYAYDETPAEGHVMQFGDGPRATPLIVGDHIYTIGIAGQMHCLDKKTGKVTWSHDLWDEFDHTFLNHGYSSSPFAYKNSVIALVGGEKNAIVAFDQKDGKLLWKNQSFTNSYSTPRLIEVDGETQLLCYMGEELASINPDNGDLYWSYEIGNQWGQNVSQPIFGDENVLFFSTVQDGSRGLRLQKEGGEWKPEELWSSRRVQFYHVPTVGIGDYVYGCSGSGMGQAGLFCCVNRKTGEIMWKIRGMSKATTLYADGKFIILDENGKLTIAKANPEEFELLSESTVLDNPAWSAPTLVGSTLYLRDKKNIMALDLSSSKS